MKKNFLLITYSLITLLTVVLTPAQSAEAASQVSQISDSCVVSEYIEYLEDGSYFHVTISEEETSSLSRSVQTKSGSKKQLIMTQIVLHCGILPYTVLSNTLQVPVQLVHPVPTRSTSTITVGKIPMPLPAKAEIRQSEMPPSSKKCFSLQRILKTFASF